MITLRGNNSLLLFTGTDSLMYETEDVYEDFSNDKEMFDFSNYSIKLEYQDNSNKLVVDKMKDEKAVVANKEFIVLKPKICSYLVDDSSEHEKAKGVNKNVVATIIYNAYKDVLLNFWSLRRSMNRIQRKDHKIGTYGINEISLFDLDDKRYI